MAVNGGCLPSEAFLAELVEFFRVANNRHISVRIGMKRLVPRDSVEGRLEFDAVGHPHYDVSQKSTLAAQVAMTKDISRIAYPILIRASYGSHDKKVKCSTTVDEASLDKFWKDYSVIVRRGMEGLIKKKKKNKNKQTKSKKNPKKK